MAIRNSLIESTLDLTSSMSSQWDVGIVYGDKRRIRRPKVGARWNRALLFHANSMFALRLRSVSWKRQRRWYDACIHLWLS